MLSADLFTIIKLQCKIEHLIKTILHSHTITIHRKFVTLQKKYEFNS